MLKNILLTAAILLFSINSSAGSILKCEWEEDNWPLDIYLDTKEWVGHFELNERMVYADCQLLDDSSTVKKLACRTNDELYHVFFNTTEKTLFVKEENLLFQCRD